MTIPNEARRKRLERAERECQPGACRKTVFRRRKRFTLVARNKVEMERLELMHEQIELVTGGGLRRAALGIQNEVR
jgi:hypothetical protein